MKWRIDEQTIYSDSYEVEADTRDEAILAHGAGRSEKLPITISEGHIVDVVPLEAVPASMELEYA